jgi:hypothetical protein
VLVLLLAVVVLPVVALLVLAVLLLWVISVAKLLLMFMFRTIDDDCLDRFIVEYEVTDPPRIASPSLWMTGLKE